jgi:HTH-type transcriptional regulator/antitoxin HigA
MAKIIKTESEHRDALTEIERLMDSDPPAGTPEAEKLELLGLLVEQYESSRFKLRRPTPLEAIEFRMEQQSLAPRDLIPFLGSRSKVSEILSGKRPLTLAMVRALHEGLGIPAEVLIQDAGLEALENETEEDWSKYPIKEMIRRGWVDQSIASVKAFFGTLPATARAAVLFRKSESVRSARSMDAYSLAAWTTQILHRAAHLPGLSAYRSGVIDLEFMRTLARLSRDSDGPLAARNFLHAAGIALVIEPHLPYTYLDGAAILGAIERPVIGLSLRYDRLDNFWFTLMHEVAHVALHAESGVVEFIDDLDVKNGGDPKEEEADQLADEALVPAAEWKRSPASRLRSPQAAEFLAQQLRVHPAIVAGKMRHHWNAYRMFNNLIGHRDVRRLFPDIIWPD